MSRAGLFNWRLLWEGHDSDRIKPPGLLVALPVGGLLGLVSGLAGYATTANEWPAGIPVLVITAVLGALIGSELGLRRFAPQQPGKVLAIVLAISGAKMIATA